MIKRVAGMNYPYNLISGIRYLSSVICLLILSEAS